MVLSCLRCYENFCRSKLAQSSLLQKETEERLQLSLLKGRVCWDIPLWDLSKYWGTQSLFYPCNLTLEGPFPFTEALGVHIVLCSPISARPPPAAAPLRFLCLYIHYNLDSVYFTQLGLSLYPVNSINLSSLQ